MQNFFENISIRLGYFRLLAQRSVNFSVEKQMPIAVLQHVKLWLPFLLL